MTGLGIDAELSEAAPRGRRRLLMTRTERGRAPRPTRGERIRRRACAMTDEPRTYGLKALHLAGLTWYARTLTTEDVHSTGIFQGRMCTLRYIGERGSGAQ